MRTVMEESVMNEPSDAGSIPASSISCTKEGPGLPGGFLSAYANASKSELVRI